MSQTPAGLNGGDTAALIALLRRAGAMVECEIVGASMGTAIPPGSMVRIRCDGASAAREGDVVALVLGRDALTVHRLIYRGRSRRAQNYVLTHGDGNLSCDTPLAVSQLLGVVDRVRARDADAWTSPASFVPRGGLRSAFSAAVNAAMRLALELHPSIARGAKRGVVLLMTPWVWLHPYPQDRMRVASRHAGASAQ